MNRRRERLVRAWFDRAVDVPRDERESFLVRAGLRPEILAQVQDLLDRDAAAAPFLSEPLLQDEREGNEDVPARIGPYRILRRIGRGGSGVVYLGEAADGRHAAVKVLGIAFDTAESRRRFLAEQEILTALRHPAIASFREAGSTVDGLPWLATEYVEGAPITRHADAAGFPVRARLEIFLAVCEAVRYAHINLLVHRDLKPGNILVDHVGRPKLLDFGIAKLLEDAGETTATEERVLTLNYASPEHLSGRRVTTASDVYSLGVILCELLCGSRPWDWSGRSRADVGHALATAAPPRLVRLLTGPEAEAVARARDTSPEALRRQVRGDLEAIVARALSYEPENRYGSVEALAADVRRYLAGEPVLARPRSARYRAGRFLRRHAGAAVATAVTVVGLLAFAAVSRYQLVEMRRERTAAETARSEAERVTAVLVESFESASTPQAVGGMTAATRILEQGTLRASRLSQHPLLQASLRHALGVAYSGVGLFEQSRGLFDQALETRRRELGPDHPLTLATLLASVAPFRNLSQLDEAERRARSVLAARRQSLGESNGATAEAAAQLAMVLTSTGKDAEALELAEGAARVHRSTGPDDEALMFDLEVLQMAHLGMGRYALAEQASRELLAVARRRYGEEHTEVAVILHNLASALIQQGRLEEAEPLVRQAIAVDERLLSPHHPLVASFRDSLGQLLLRQARYDAALVELEAALAICRQAFGENHLDVAFALNGIGHVLYLQGYPERAEVPFREALAIRRRLLPATHRHIADSLNNVAVMLRARGIWGESERLLRESLAIFRAALGPSHREVATALSNLALVVWNGGRADEAGLLFQQATEVYRAALGPTHTQYALSLTNLAWFHRRRGDPAGAEPLARQALDVRRKALGDRHPETGDSMAELGAILAVSGQPDEARREAARAIEAYRGTLPDSNPRVGKAHLVHGLARVLLRDPAGEREALAAYASILAGSPPNSIQRADAADLLARARRRVAIPATRH